MNAKRVKQLIDGLQIIMGALQEEYATMNQEGTTPTDTNPHALAQKAVNTVEAGENESGSAREAELNAMKYNELKSLAKKMGLDVTGTKTDLVSRIFDAEYAVDVVEDADEPTDSSDDGDEEGLDLEALLEELDDETTKELAKALGIKVTSKSKIADIQQSIIDFDNEELLIDTLVDMELVEVDEEEENGSDETDGAEESDEEGIDVEEILTELDDAGIKALAKALGIKVGIKTRRNDLVEAILDFEDEDALVTALVEQGLVELSDEDGEEDSDDDEETLADKIEAELSDMTDKEIIQILADVGVSAKGKREALLAKVVTAVEEGLLSLE